MKIPLSTGSSYTARTLAAAAQECRNLFTETVQVPEGKSQQTLYLRPGTALMKDLTSIDTPIRGVWTGGGRLFVVCGSTLVELNADGSGVPQWDAPVERMDVGDDASHSPAQIIANGSQILVISAGLAYYDAGDGNNGQCMFPAPTGTCTVASGAYGGDATSIITIDNYPTERWSLDLVGGNAEAMQLTIAGDLYTVVAISFDGHYLWLDPTGDQPTAGTAVAWTGFESPVTASSAAFLDGYFIVSRPYSKQINISGLYDASSWDPLDFAIKEGYPDNILSIIADHEELWLLGTESIEPWRNTGNADFPFERIGGAFIHQGSFAPWAPVAIGGSLCWLGADSRGGIVAYRSEGYSPRRISTYAVEESLRSSTTIGAAAAAVGYAYSEAGHWFWVLSFDTVQWVYDLTENAWHERTFWNGTSHLLPKSTYHTFIPEWGGNGMHIVGDRGSGKLYEQSLNYTDDDGDEIRWTRSYPHLCSEQKFLYLHRVQLDIEVGTTEEATEPIITLEISRDGGRTFGTGKEAGLGDTADYLKRVVWRALGKGRDIVLRFSGTTKSKIAIVDGYAEASEGRA